MSFWPSTKARVVLRALLKIGWYVERQSATSHKVLRHKADKFPPYVWAFGDGDELGPKIIARIAKHTGLRREDL